ncbi:MAG: DUF3368 domain-containing protein [Nitrospirae bacterium]|nr:DUF3368 domain-containing protein [Nitrospirota bacterium]
MRVVSDADVLIHLSKLEQLSLLKSLYNEVAIPEYVKRELFEKEHKELQKALNSFLKTYQTSEEKAGEIAKNHGIHSGEAHVKALGEKLKATLFLSNERKVRKAAKEEGFIVVGTIGIILKAVKNDVIKKSEAITLLGKMTAEDFRMHPDILKKAIDIAREL